MSPLATSHDPGGESIPSGEEAAINRIVAIHLEVQETSDRLRAPVPRGQHPKGHGCVRGGFIVEPDLPEDLRHGVFRETRALPALIRFSNGARWDDTKPDVHGMAVKLLGIEGEKVLGSEKDATTQDFVMIDHPVFFVRNVPDYIPFMENFRWLRTSGLSLGKALAVLRVMVSPRYRLLRAAMRKTPDSPLRIRYWSTTPYRLGSGAMKFSARPDLTTVPPPSLSNSRDKLREAMSAHLKRHEVCFDFLVQLQTVPVAMPIEDPTVAWDEAISPYQKAATIRIPSQSFESAEQMALCEDLSFTPWHALVEHRPLGGINRTRKEVYEAISRRRHEWNGVRMQEPSLD